MLYADILIAESIQSPLRLGVIIFGLVQFLTIKNNQTGFFEKKPKPSQTDRFRSNPVRFLISKNGENLYAHISSRTRQ
jgi:hypothetical protein